jgi:hypothetical protein
MKPFQRPLELIAILFGGITFGTAYYLLFLAHPAWSSVPFEVFLPVFQALILKIGMSQIIVSNIALVAGVILFFMSRDWSWLIAVVLLLISLPVTMMWLMPINIHFLEAVEPALSDGADAKLAAWGNYQIIRFITDGLALAAMAKPLIWRKSNL